MTQNLDKEEAERTKKAKDQAFVAAGSASLVLEEAERPKKAKDQAFVAAGSASLVLEEAERTKKATDEESARVKKANEDKIKSL
jgi:hypothetical protein